MKSSHDNNLNPKTVILKITIYFITTKYSVASASKKPHLKDKQQISERLLFTVKKKHLNMIIDC